MGQENTISTSIIASAPYFSALSARDCSELASLSSTVRVRSKQQIFARDDPSDAVYLVVNGEISISVTDEHGRIHRIAHVCHNEVFGEFGALDGGKRTADATALCEGMLLRIPRQAFLKTVINNPALSEQVIIDVISKLRMTNMQIEEVAFLTLRARVARLLMHLSDDGEQTVIKMTQIQLAARLNATRENVNKHLQTFRTAGAIQTNRGTIKIVDMTKIAHYFDEMA